MLTNEVPEWSAQFDLSSFDLGRVFTTAHALGKSAYDVLAEKGYPVFKFSSDGKVEPIEDATLLSKAAGATGSESAGHIRLTASTNAIDLIGDVMESEAMQEMAKAAPGTTVFRNHSYQVPDDVFGTVISADIITKTLPHPLTKEPTQYTCLEYVVDPVSREENKKSYQTAQMIRKGKRKLGASVTVLILEKQQDADKRRIKHVYYIETSIVGVPCNPLSWVHSAQKALNGAQSPLALTAAQPLTTTVTQKAMNTETTNQAAPAVTSKGAFADEFANRTGSIYFLTGLLTSAIQTIWGKYRRDKQTAVKDEVATALTEFSAAVLEKVVPMVESASTSEMGYYDLFNAADGAGLALDLLKKSFPGGASDELSKSGARNSKKDSERLQNIHDHCCELGAKCMTSEKAAPLAPTSVADVLNAHTAADFETKVASLTTEVAQKDARLVELAAQLQTTQTDSAMWKASSLTATALAEQLAAELGSQPFPRATAGV